MLYGDTTFLTIGIEDIQTAPVAEYKLYQNYPNPFNLSTSISYNLPQRSYIKLKVYDLLGKEIAILINEEKESGNHTERFNVKYLSSGIYIYELIAENFRESKKMILIK